MTNPATDPATAPATDPGAASLDETVFTARERLRAAEIPAPRVLFLMATGVGFLPAHLVDPCALELGEITPEQEPWSAQVLHAGHLGALPVWCLEDVSGELLEREPRSAWVRGFPVWLAAAAGAQLCVHGSAGSALAPLPGLVRSSGAIEGLALVRDHLNVSGSTPLLGLGPSRLGPLFPDLTRLHHLGLRRAAQARAEALGIPAAEAIAACTHGPALETPAERTMLARLGAEVAVQALATPLLAAAHSGLSLLAIGAVTDARAGTTEVPELVDSARRLQPALEDLLLALVPDLAAAADARASEDAP